MNKIFGGFDEGDSSANTNVRWTNANPKLAMIANHTPKKLDLRLSFDRDRLVLVFNSLLNACGVDDGDLI